MQNFGDFLFGFYFFLLFYRPFKLKLTISVIGSVLMLMHYTDIDAHLDMLEDLDGYMFRLSALELTRFSSRSFFNHVLRTILSGDKEHTLLVIEQLPRRWEKYVMRQLSALGRNVDGNKDHHIHVFFVSSEMFGLMLLEFTDWD